MLKIRKRKSAALFDELDETIDSQKQVDKIIGSVSSYDEFDEDLKDELDKLMKESEMSSVDNTIRKDETKSLNNSLLGLKIADNVVIQVKTETSNVSKVPEPAMS
ncbi:hypothetical protein Tco_0773873 [Tanacetum coccineum]|uniref:Uncharacterized protein n=1 Tax=Tanacetum coccineum TaxID=301880 RepID=A0ABQ4ZPX5_9ASTR